MVQISDIQVILVLYEQNLTSSKSYISLKNIFSKQVEVLHLYVYDNSTVADKDIPQEEGLPYMSLEYVHDASNPGVSKAYNMGASFALKNNKMWLLLLDQDSIFDQSLFAAFISGQHKYPNNYLFAPLLKSGEYFISPCKYYLNKGFATRSKTIGIQKNRFKSVLNSGIFIEVHTFHKIGGYNEHVPLYFSDFVFFKRYNSWFDSFVVLDSIIHHHLSDMSTHSLSNSIRTFRLFAGGARQASTGFMDFIKYGLVVSGRAIVLSARYKSLKFFTLLYRNFLRGRNTGYNKNMESKTGK